MLKHDRRYTEMSKKKDIATAILGIMTGLILWLTILSREKLIGAPIVYTPFHEILSMWKSIQRSGLTGNFIGNIILFVPVGFLFPIAAGKEKWYLTILSGLVFSLLIELVQRISCRGCFDPDDVLLNTIGLIIGFELLRVLKWLRNKNK